MKGIVGKHMSSDYQLSTRSQHMVNTAVRTAEKTTLTCKLANGKRYNCH